MDEFMSTATSATSVSASASTGTSEGGAGPSSTTTGTSHQRQSSSPVTTTTSTTSTPKIVSRNVNGTLVLTSAPGNEAELQLYRVMQRASLLAYYDTLLEMGGDDVQQLCDAGEEEFLEIMALVGMASKPLHVRRLQKALQEWVSNPALFQMPLMPGGPGPFAPTPTRPIKLSPQPLIPTNHNNNNNNHHNHTNNNHHHHHHHQHNHSSPGGSREAPHSPGPAPLGEYVSQGPSTPGPTPSPGRGPSTSTSPGPPGSPLQLTPVLVDVQIGRLAEAADHLVRSLPQFEPKPHNTKKKMCKDLEYVMNMADDDPRRMDEIRKYAAIYGRFDCKRKPEKPLTLHEVSVNEAAAQICRIVPALLTRRDELFPLARQVVRDSGYHYSKGHSNLSGCHRSHAHGVPGGRGGSNGDEHYSKRMRLESANSLSPTSNDFLELDAQARLRRQERMEQVADELRALGERTEELVGAAQQVRERNDYQALHTLQQQMEMLQSKQTQLLVEQSDLSKQQPRYFRRSSGRMSSCFDSERPDTDDTDSQFSFSNASSPCQEIGDSRDSTRDAEVNGVGGVLDLKSGVLSGKISKQMVHDTLLDEGLRVVKELVANQSKESSETSSQGHGSYESAYHENKVQVIASSGGNIIAVANPALSMSPAIPDASVDASLLRAAMKQEPASPPSPTPRRHDEDDD